MQHASNMWQNNCIPGSVASPVVMNSMGPTSMNYGGLPPEVAQTSTAMYSNTSTFSWAHTVPSLMPWVTKSESRVPDPIVHFTAPIPPDPCTSQTATSWELLNNLGTNRPSVNSHLKRKSDPEMLDAMPQKVCATEERMAARFREMHISNQYAVPTESSSFVQMTPDTTSQDDSITNINQLDYLIKGSEIDLHSPSKSLVLAPELKKLVEPEKLFANAFLNKVERPSMALVLWQPQNNSLMKIDPDESKKDNPVNNNNSSHQQVHLLCSSETMPTAQEGPVDVEMDL